MRDCRRPVSEDLQSRANAEREQALRIGRPQALAETQSVSLPPSRLAAILARLFRSARSSAVEHHLDMVGVTGSIPVARTTLSSALHS